MARTVVIDCFPESASIHRRERAIIAVDVIRATTTISTAVALGRECFPVPTIEAAIAVAERLTEPLLVGELGGNMPYGFDLTNSPAELAARTDVHRPMVILSTSGTRLIAEAEGAEAVYVASLRNYSVQAKHAAEHHDQIAVIGAGARGQFREEDQLCCAWIAAELLQAGYQPDDLRTAEVIDRWTGVSVDAVADGPSAEYLRRTDQLRDLEFVLTHVNDLTEVYAVEVGRVIRRRFSMVSERSALRSRPSVDLSAARRGGPP
jgi:2-phosphosulfolactate phosphatase